MKDQQRSNQSLQTRENREREQRAAQQKQTTWIPSHQWAQLLQNLDNSLLDLPVSLLEQLAKSVGNSHLAELLRQGGGSGAEIFTPETLVWEEPQPEENKAD